MAALGFFRKHQKFVFWIMVALMLAFVLSMGGMRTLMDRLINPIANWISPDAAHRPIGTVGPDDEEILGIELGRSRDDMKILDEFVRLGDVFRVLGSDPLVGAGLGITGVPGEEGYMRIGQQDDSRLCWTLLLAEADRMGIQAGDRAVEEFLTSLGISGERRRGIVDRMQRGNRDWSEKRLFRAVDNYLRITRMAETVAGGVVVTEPELRQQYRNLAEMIGLAMIRFEAKDFLAPAQTPPPTDAQAADLFERHKANPRGQAGPDNPFGIGFRAPAKVQMEYLLISMLDLLGQAVEPAEKAMADYFNKHPGEFTRRELVMPATAPDATAATSEPVFRDVPITRYSEAKEQVRQKLRADAAQKRMVSIVEQAKKFVQQEEGKSAEASVLERVHQAMRDAGLPVSFTRTGGMLTREEFAQAPVLGQLEYRGPRGGMLVDAAFSVTELHPDNPRNTPWATVGQVSGQVLDWKFGEVLLGKVIWRVSAVVPSQAPALPTPEMLAQAKEDLNLVAGFDRARLAANDARAIAICEGLAAAADAFAKTVIETGPVPRQVLQGTFRYSASDMVLRIVNWDRSGRQGPAPFGAGFGIGFYAQALNGPTLEIGTPAVPGVSQAARLYFLREAFKLAPFDGKPIVPAVPMPTGQPDTVPDLQPDTAPQTQPTTMATTMPTTYPTSAPAAENSLAIIPLPGDTAVLLVQRTEFIPAYQGDYEQARVSFMRRIDLLKQQKFMMRWFIQDNIVSRTGYDPTGD